MAVNGIYNALSGLHAHRQMLDTTAHNISNQLTPGYRRQVLDLAPMSSGSGAQVFSGQGAQTLGVDVVDTRRVLDEMSERRASTAVGTAVDASTTHRAMLRIEELFGEPGEFGVASQLEGFWISWSDLADRADNPVARTEVLTRASNLIDRLQQASDDLRIVGQDSQRRLSTMAMEVNTITAQIADMNKAVAASATTPNSLLDKRDLLASKLVTMVGAQVRTTERGQIAVSIGGRIAVSNGSAYPISHDGATLVWEPDGSALRPGPSELASINALNQETLPNVRADIDAIVAQLVTETNDLHRQGYGLDGVTGRNFFDPAGLTIETIALSADVVDAPEHLAAGAPTLPGPVAPGLYDGRQAQLLGDLTATGDATSDYRVFAARLGIAVNAANRTAESTQQIADRALDDAESVSGVSLDEEMATMLAAQQGYEASARVLTAINEMLHTLMELIR